jgi:hypothetical protein
MRTNPKRRVRVDVKGAAYKGSQRQIQLYVNRHATALSEAIRSASSALGASKPLIEWVSPLERHGFAEYQDHGFLTHLRLDHVQPDLAGFWPRRGPVWDALARLPDDVGQTRGVLLVEAKSYLDEIEGGGCKARSTTSIGMINRALDDTASWLGVSRKDCWTGCFYQYANRLAHAYFLRKAARLDAWLVNVHFTDDPHRSTSREEWAAGLRDMKERFGLAPQCDCVIDIFLPAIVA